MRIRWILLMLAFLLGWFHGPRAARGHDITEGFCVQVDSSWVPPYCDREAKDPTYGCLVMHYGHWDADTSWVRCPDSCLVVDTTEWVCLVGGHEKQPTPQCTWISIDSSYTEGPCPK